MSGGKKGLLHNTGVNLQLLTKLPGLSPIEALLSEKCASEAPEITKISRYLLELGGKRIRPVLTLLCGQLFGVQPPYTDSPAGQRLIDIAAGIELIHMATLLHDDIIDDSPVRRHKPSPYKLYGTNSTLLAGDFLLTRAFGLCARLDRFVIDRTEAACVALTEGEILETSLLNDQHDIRSSLLVAEKKTAALFSLAAETASHIAGLAPEGVRAMARFGNELGIAFQILDDILDVTSDEATLGKRSGQDLRERKPSLVNVLWLSERSPAGYQQLLEPQSEKDEAWVTSALRALPKSPVIGKARTMAEERIERASVALKEACSHYASRDEGTHQSSLELIEMLMQYVLERVH
jgi:geranylgeranyl pyrophosphate synthase